MNNLSERVQRELNEWKEKYEIPYDQEFNVTTLLKLQEEYDSVESGSNTTKTRESLLSMINRIHMSLKIKSKETLEYNDEERVKFLYRQIIFECNRTPKEKLTYEGLVVEVKKNKFDFIQSEYIYKVVYLDGDTYRFKEIPKIAIKGITH